MSMRTILENLLLGIDERLALLTNARNTASGLLANLGIFDEDDGAKPKRRVVRRKRRAKRQVRYSNLTIADHILKAIDAGHHTRSEIDAYMRKSRKGMGAQAVPSALQGLKRKGLVVLKGDQWKRA